MGHRSRSVLVQIFTNFIASLKPRSFKGELVGKDHFGNSYYQIKGDGRQRSQRWFDPKDKDNFEQEIPAEWESWLRNRRKVPPLEEEVLANFELAKLKKLNAAELEAQRKPKLPEGGLKKEVRGVESFPKYDEYEITPGEKNKQR